MDITIQRIHIERDYELVERKGRGHPDTLADGLAEELSAAYSRYTRETFGIILHHNFDKVGLLGGSSSVEFGGGSMTSPIRVLINGRVSECFGEHKIPYWNIITSTVKSYFNRTIPLIDINKDLKIINNLSHRSSPGQTDIETKETRKHWFTPRDERDVVELAFLTSNDTSVGVGYAPLTQFERAVLELENMLTDTKFHDSHRWLGTDIKIMAVRKKNVVDVTICLPQISVFVQTIEEYKDNLKTTKEFIVLFLQERLPDKSIRVYTNTRDNYETGEIYLTVTGSSIESGDEGLVGRGNRINQIIGLTKPYTMEGAAGKNPVYHVGKLYAVAAQQLAEQIANNLACYCEVFIASQSGRSLVDPWHVIIGINKDLKNEEQVQIRAKVTNACDAIPKLTNLFLQGKLKLA